ncbi:MAG: sulfotransferase family protein [Hydrococcus sp. SU_1_0]|nr:sulfotransferase family protein [Hydrococcus sp. SU_1_0]
MEVSKALYDLSKLIVQKNPPIIEKIWGATDQYSFIENNRDISFDFIGRFENLQEDVNKIYNMTNTEKAVEIPHEVMAENREERQDYLKYYDEESIEIVNELFHRDFQAFGYQPIGVKSSLPSRQIQSSVIV